MPIATRTERAPRGYYYSFAQNEEDVRDSLALRHRVFVKEMGAHVAPSPAGLETDAMDDYCLHLIVREAVSDRAVASTRILTHEAAIAAGHFYSATEFNIDPILDNPGRFLEIGRTCVERGHRSGAAIAMLWNGLEDLIQADDYDHLIGCASIDLRDGVDRAHAICRDILARRSLPASQRVTPRLALPAASSRLARAVRLPPLIKAYLRLGARVGGLPCYDPVFGVANVFMHMDVARLSPRYARHFLGTSIADREIRLTA